MFYIAYFIATHVDVDTKGRAVSYTWGNKRTKTEGWIRFGNITSWMKRNMKDVNTEAPIWGIGGSIDF